MAQATNSSAYHIHAPAGDISAIWDPSVPAIKGKPSMRFLKPRTVAAMFVYRGSGYNIRRIMKNRTNIVPPE